MEDIIAAADHFVLELFKKKLSGHFLYHNYHHTNRVVKCTKELIGNSEINVKQADLLILAAWFHDTGYTVKYQGHEEESVKIFHSFTELHSMETEDIKTVERCILATKFGSKPNDILEKIIQDADTAHFGKDYFEETSELLRSELKLLNIQEYTTEEWITENIRMLTDKHRFHTDYALKNWSQTKGLHLKDLLEKENVIEEKLAREETKAKLKAHYKNESPDRSIQSVYRITLRNHIKLSDIADTKANILLSVNAIIISLALANILPELETTNQYLLTPTLILVCFSVASIILAIMSTRPNVTKGEFTKDEVKNREVNVLFFGNFHKMPFDQFKWAMLEIMDDQDYIYEALIRDLHSLGIVLNRKYKLLRITYTVFTIGIITSVVGFIITFASI